MSGILPKSPPPQNLTPMDAPVEQVNTRPAPITTRLNETFALGVQKQLNRAEINKAVDIRPPATALLTINSADRYQPNSLVDRYNNPNNGAPYTLTSPADFTITIPQNLMNGYFTRVAVTQVSMPYAWGAVTNSTNGFYIHWQPGGTGAVTRYFVSLAANPAQQIPGSPGSTTLAAAIQTAVRLATGSTTFVCSYNAVYTALFFFNSANTDKFYFSRWTSPTGVNAITLFDMMGMTATQILATSQNSTPSWNLWRTPFIDIVCEQITANQSLRDASTTSGAGRTLLARIYVGAEGSSTFLAGIGASPVSMYQKTYTNPKQISWLANQPIGGTLRIQLLDAQGYVLTNGANYNDATGNLGSWCDANMPDWNMVLQLTEQ